MAALGYATTANSSAWISTTYAANTFATQPIVTFTRAGGLPESVRKARFEEFHAANPEIYSRVTSMIDEKYDKPLRKLANGTYIRNPISVRQIFAQLRLEGIKVDNNHVKFYTLKLREDYPQFATRFRTRGY